MYREVLNLKGYEAAYDTYINESYNIYESPKRKKIHPGGLHLNLQNSTDISMATIDLEELTLEEV